jgi:phospholipase C
MISKICRVSSAAFLCLFAVVLTSCGAGPHAPSPGPQTPQQDKSVAVTINANPTTINAGQSVTLTITASNASSVTISNNIDITTIQVPVTGGTQTVTPKATITYTVTATGSNSTTATATTTVTVKVATVQAVNHVLFLMQENRSFDSYFGMLNPYRKAKGWDVGDDSKTYDVDGIDDKLGSISNVNDSGTSFKLFKLATTCVDDMTSDWLGSYGSVNRYNFNVNRPILMDGFVHIAENFAKGCSAAGCGSGVLTDDFEGKRAMGYYDEGFLNYYYYMASQFAVSDRWFSPVASKSTPNRIATMAGGTTQGLVKDPFRDNKLGTQLNIPTIFGALDKAKVSWKIYYSLTLGGCTDPEECGKGLSFFPVTTFSDFTDSFKYLHAPDATGQCAAPTISSQQAVGDPSNAFCIDPKHIAPLNQLFTDMTNGTLPAFAWIEPAYGISDEHPGSGQSILAGQAATAKMVNALMNSPSWNDSVFFVSFDEGGGPYDHVPPVPGHTNDKTDSAMGITTDISSIAVNPDNFFPCLPQTLDPVTGLPVATLHCDLSTTFPGAVSSDAPAVKGFAAQLGFRLPNLIVSPFTRKHFVGHTPMDHTAVLKFVESRFIGPNAHLTPRDAAQPDLLEFFDFNAVPWSTPPTKATDPPPTPVGNPGPTCTPGKME